MSATVSLDDALYERARVAAGQRGISVSAVIEEALNLFLTEPSRQEQAIGPMPADHTMSWVRQGIDIDDMRGLRQVMDGGRDIDALR